jgi:uncharacterized membrane protein YdjX (TVP38/TMEM64 family)
VSENSENTSTAIHLALNPEAVPRHHRTLWGVALKLLLAFAIIAALVVVWDVWIQPYEIQLNDAMARIGPWGPTLFIIVFIIASMVFFPESILAIAAGTIWGLWWGLLWVVVAGTLAAIVVFWLGRHVFRERVEKLLTRHPKVQAIDSAASTSGFKLAFLLRLAPISFSMLNLLLAVSRLRFRTYLLTCIGMFPGNFSTVYIGFAARHTADLARQLKQDPTTAAPSSIVHELTLYVGLAASLMCSIVVARIALNAIRQATSNAVITSHSEIPAPSSTI